MYIVIDSYIHQLPLEKVVNNFLNGTIEKLGELEIVRFLMSFKQCGRKVVEKWSNALIIFFVLYIILGSSASLSIPTLKL